MVHAYNISTQGTEPEEFLVEGQPGLHRESVLNKTKTTATTKIAVTFLH